MTDGMVDKLSKILNQAERAEEGSPEREAFMEKALALSAAFSIDLAVARAHQASKERTEEPERRSHRVSDGSGSLNKRAHFVDLMLAICEANDIKCVISGNNTFVHGTGMPSDHAMAERLFAILSVQMVSEADAALKAGANGEVRTTIKRARVEIPDDERAWGQHDGGESYGDSAYYDHRDDEVRDGMRRGDGYRWVKSYPPPKYRLEPVLDAKGQPVYEEKWVATEDARIWRPNFYQGFINRVRYRLAEARRDALKAAGIKLTEESSGAVALRNKAKEVQDAFEENEKFVLSTGKTYGGAEVSRLSYGGAEAGDNAGKRAKLGNERDLGH